MYAAADIVSKRIFGKVNDIENAMWIHVDTSEVPHHVQYTNPRKRKFGKFSNVSQPKTMPTNRLANHACFCLTSPQQGG